MKSESATVASKARMRWWLLTLFVLAAALRIGWVAIKYRGDYGAVLTYPDEEAYYTLARSLSAGCGLTDQFGFRATYMPVYPAFIALLTWLPGSLFWVRVAQALLGAWVAPATFLLAERFFSRYGSAGVRPASMRRPLLAGLFVAVDPFLIFFSGLLLTETLFVAALVTAWGSVLPMINGPIRFRHSLAAGALLLLCVLLRPAAVILVILGPLTVVLFRSFDRLSLTASVVVVGIVLVGLFPWAARNRVILGQWRWLTTRSGISLYDGLRVGATGGSDLAATKTMPEVADLSETEWDDYFQSKAWSAAREDPLRIARLGVTKFLRTWSLIPNVEEYRRAPVAIISGVWMTVVLILAALGWWIHRRLLRAWIALLLPVIGFTLLHTVFVGSVRYRVPVMPMMMILAAAGISFVVDRVWAKSTRAEHQREYLIK